MKSAPGTCALILRSDTDSEITIGLWGSLRLSPGYYVYVGSAFGPGGVRARVARHFRRAKRNRWHIDYLRAAVEVECAWCSYEPRRLEHQWAQALERLEDVSCIAGFGSSDCSCSGHLFAMPKVPVSEDALPRRLIPSGSLHIVQPPDKTLQSTPPGVGAAGGSRVPCGRG